MNTFSAFPSIEQFRHAITTVEQHFRYRGRDENGKPLYDAEIALPIITFIGTVKLHGTNAAVGFCEDNVWAQSRKRVLLGDEADNFGFRRYVEQHVETFRLLCQHIPHEKGDRVYIYGEWCGKDVQRNVAIAEVSRRFVVFAAKVVRADGDDDDDDSDEQWCDQSTVSIVRAHSADVYNIYDYASWIIDIDFGHPSRSQERLEQITDQVERECPVALQFGQSGTGEGVVWTAVLPDRSTVLRFKVKGLKHTVTKVKTGAACRTEPIVGVAEFVDKTVTENRLEQGVGEIFGENETVSMKKTFPFIQWVTNDVLKEESDTLRDSGLTEKDVSKALRAAARVWLIEKCKT